MTCSVGLYSTQTSAYKQTFFTTLWTNTLIHAIHLTTMKFFNTFTSMGLIAVSMLTPMAAGMRRMVNKPLDKSVADSFLKCLKDTGVDYHISVDTDGHTVVSPVEQRGFDFDGKDAALRKCVDDHFGKMKLAMESNLYPDPNAARKVAAHASTAEDLASQGALGHAAEKYVQQQQRVRRDSMVSSRAPENFDIYLGLNKDDNCASQDLTHEYANECHSHASSYASVICTNLSDTQNMDCILWPHHDCGQGNDKTYSVQPGVVSECIIRTTYSYKGIYR